MHEVALMESVLAIVRDDAARQGFRGVTAVKLVVGEFAMAVPDSLSFAFEVLTREEELFAGAVLNIEVIPLRCRCKSCGHDFHPADHYDLRCTHCAAGVADIISGREMKVQYYEGE